MNRAFPWLGLLLGGILLAQQSSGFKLTEHTFNAGGNPSDGLEFTSTNYRVSLSAIGQGVATPAALTSTSFGMEGGFLGGLPPPGDVSNLRFTDDTTLAWDPERSVGFYNLYQGTISQPFDPDFGACESTGITNETTSITTLLSPGEGIFLLVTAENLLGEEGTKGWRSSGGERPNPAPCP
jgi:hypothetical protein